MSREQQEQLFPIEGGLRAELVIEIIPGDIEVVASWRIVECPSFIQIDTGRKKVHRTHHGIANAVNWYWDALSAHRTIHGIPLAVLNADDPADPF